MSGFGRAGISASSTILFAALAATSAIGQPGSAEVRALWVQRTSLTSASRALSAVETARDAGFNTLIVQVRGRGDAFYTSRHEPRAAALSTQPASFDPFEVILTSAHRAGLKVHAWVNVNLISAPEPAAARSHLVHTHPEWLMVPRSLAADLARINPRNPEYLKRLSEYTKARADRVEGMFLSPVLEGSIAHTLRVIDEITSRYDVDGIHLDYLRFPNDEFDYSAAALEAFRSDVLSVLSGAERREYSGRARGRPLFYTEMFPQRWQEFRRSRLTELLTKIRTIVKTRRPGAMLTAAVFPDVAEANTRRFQDWGGWLQAGLLDAVCPMTYTTDSSLFRAQIETVEQRAGRSPVWAGIGAYQLSPSATIENIRTARQLGAEGVILFSYDNLNSDYVDTVANAAFR